MVRYKAVLCLFKNRAMKTYESVENGMEAPRIHNFSTTLG